MRKADVKEFFRTDLKTAAFLGISHQAVGQWPDPIPVKWALYLDEATQGQLEFDKRMYQNGYKSGD